MSATCPICLDEIAHRGSDPCRACCAAFHPGCLRDWRECQAGEGRQPSCPNCRAPMAPRATDRPRPPSNAELALRLQEDERAARALQEREYQMAGPIVRDPFMSAFVHRTFHDTLVRAGTPPERAQQASRMSTATQASMNRAIGREVQEARARRVQAKRSRMQRVGTHGSDRQRRHVCNASVRRAPCGRSYLGCLGLCLHLAREHPRQSFFKDAGGRLLCKTCSYTFNLSDDFEDVTYHFETRPGHPTPSSLHRVYRLNQA